MSQVINVQDSVIVSPSGYTNLTNFTTSTSYPISNGYDDVNSNSYVRLSLASGATGYLDYTFNVQGIPSNATIDSIVAQVKIRVNNTNNVTNTICRLYSGTTAKGSNTTFASTSTSNIITLTPGSWTASELSNLRLRIGGTGISSSGNTTRYIYFYGATITINYSIVGTQYSITATSTTQDVTVSPATQNLMGGESTVISFYVNDISNYTITDNGNDVTSQLVRHQIDTSGLISKTATSFTTGASSSDINFYMSASNQTNNFNYAVGHTAEDPGSTASGSGTWTYVKTSSGQTSETGWADYSFDFSDIPASATITSIEVKCYGAVESSSQSTSHSDITLYSGSIQKSTTQSFTSDTNSIITISNPGTWTRAELQEAKLRFTVGYYGGHLFGITWNVNYTVPSGQDQYYYTYTLSSINDDHIILVDSATAYIPPEEDPEKTYYPITISSINATTDPSTGTTRIEAGNNQRILISPTDPQLTLALDNGVDITSQLMGGTPNNTYSVATASGASYGFSLNSHDYYESQNAGQSSSAAVARVSFNLETRCSITFKYINYAEATYDYGIFGNIDTALGTTYSVDSNVYLSCGSSSYNSSSEQTVTYTMEAGSHFIDVKYRKDTYQDSYNDSLQFKVEIKSLESTEYTYTLENIQASHSLVFVFGNVNYYFITSNLTGDGKIFPDGQQVKLEGDQYYLDIVPDSVDAIVTVADNNTDTTSALERRDGYDKDNNPVVSYRYKLNNIQLTHIINVNIAAPAAQSSCYVKIAGEWVLCTKAYRKENNNWVEIQLDNLSNYSNYVWVNKDK